MHASIKHAYSATLHGVKTSAAHGLSVALRSRAAQCIARCRARLRSIGRRTPRMPWNTHGPDRWRCRAGV